MARKDNLRKAYEFKIGKERASKLTDNQISLLSKYYNSLSESEQSTIDNELIQGRSNDLTDMANSFVEENEDQDSSGSEDPVQQTEEKLDQELRGVSDDILKKMDELIGDYEKKISESSNKKQSGALAVYEPDRAKEDDLVDEEIDERILTLIGQEDVTDIDYGTYKSLLREKMMVGRMTDSELATEETELLTNEFKRIKGKTGRFKVRKKKLSVDDISDMGMKPSESQPERVNTSKLLPSSGQDDISEEVEDNEKEGKRNNADLAEIKGFLNKVVSPALKKIDKNLTDILKTMSMQAEFEEKVAEKATITADKKKKKGREEKMESRGGQMLSGIKDKVLAPVKGIFEMIWDFVKNVLIGGFLLFILDIINNPEKFLNGIIDFFNGIISGINDMIKGFLSPFVDAANTMIGAVNSVGQGLENAFNQALGIFGQEPQDIYKEVDPIELTENPIPLIPRIEKEEEEVKTEEKEEKETPAQALATGGPVIHLNLPGHDSGGPVGRSSGINISGMGKDTQLIAAQPGEVVMSKAAVDYHGADTLLQMNVDGGGTNQPSFGTANLMGYSGGGKVGGSTNLISHQGGGSTNLISHQGGGKVGGTTNIMGYSGGGKVGGSTNLISHQGGDKGKVSVSTNLISHQGGGSTNLISHQGGGKVGGSTNLISHQGGDKGKVSVSTNLMGYSGGGRALSSGTDTVPAMLTPGEFVMSKGAVQKIGASNLEKMNASGGGTNKPKLLNNTMYAKSGGMVGGRRSGGNSNSNVVASKDKPWWQRGMDMVGGVVNKVRNTFTPKPKPKSKPKPPSKSTPKVKPKTPTMGGYYEPGGVRPKEDFGKNLAKMLAMYESGNKGPYTEAYDDVRGIPTIGHGATYYPEGFRLKGKVKRGDSITEEEAISIKEQHITEHRERLLREIPAETYHTLPDNVKAGLESMVFNYGSLRGADEKLAPMVIKAQKEGNFKPVADLFRNKLAGHNGGINDWRRRDEAQLIEKGFSSREGYSRINFETESTTTTPKITPIETSKKLPDQAMISPKSRVTPPGPMQRSMSISALPMGGGGSSGGKGGSSVGSNQKVAPSFSSTDPNDKHLPGVMSIYQITDVG